MASLYKLIENMEEIKWNYYASFPNNNPILKPIVTDNESANFITQYFRKGGKNEAMVDFDLDHFGSQRADHTISIFFLGLILFHNSSLKDKIFFDGVVSENYEFFQFIWFVTCLSHDVAFYRENDPYLMEANTDINALKANLNIKYDLTSQQIENVPADIFELCGIYFKYRHNHPTYPGMDHGIYSGILMFDRLVKNRITKKAQQEQALLWEDFLDRHYAYAAATVAVHNIWLPKKNDYPQYANAGLSALIRRQPINFEEAPLLFLLGLVDTIDPVKAYPNSTPKEVLKNIYLTFPGPMRFRIRVSNKLDFDTLCLKAGYLCDWLSLKVAISGRAITISIKG
jgi:hypothetical protein